MWGFEQGPQSPRQIKELVSELVGPDEARVFWKEYQDAYVTREDIGLIKKLGFNSVRVPFNYRILTPEDPPGVWLDEGFAVLDRLVEWCRDAGVYVILDMHAAPGGQTGRNIDDSWGHPFLFESQPSQDLTVEIWRRLARRYRDEPAVLGYDLLNEPLPRTPANDVYKDHLEPLYRRIVAAIREVDPNHVIFLAGADWNNDFSVFGPPFAPNLAYTFHKYWNATDDASIAPYLAFRERHGVPLWLGESGENTDAWVEAARKLVERHGIGWCFWPYKKLDSPRGVLSIARPEGWEKIVAYAARRTSDFVGNAKLRPSLTVARAALSDLVRNAGVEKCRVNAGYLRTLGLEPPAPS